MGGNEPKLRKKQPPIRIVRYVEVGTGFPGAKSPRCYDFVISFIKLNFIN